MSDEEKIHQQKTKIANHAKRPEKTAWKRKQTKMQTIIDEKLAPLQIQEQELIVKKMPILDEIATVRRQMIETCIHPYDELVYLENDDVFLCKFCGSKINVK